MLKNKYGNISFYYIVKQANIEIFNFLYIVCFLGLKIVDININGLIIVNIADIYKFGI